MQIACMVLLSGHCFTANAQISAVNTIQNLSFGAFSPGNEGGTITISNTGIRSASGTAVPVNIGIPHFEAVFEIEAPNGTIISISRGAEAILRGSNGGSMSLKLGNSDPQGPFSVFSPNGKTEVRIGGTLSIGNVLNNPPGNYNGSFFITFNNE